MVSIRISEAARNSLLRIKKAKRKGNIDEVIGFLLSEHEILEQQKVNVELPKEDDSLKCINRILHDRLYWCVNKPPKMVKLLTLDICKVCKQRKLGLTESTKIAETTESHKSAEEIWKGEPQPRTLTDPNLKLNKYGMVYCADGLWIFPSKCEHCKKISFPKWDDCQKRKERQEVKL